MMGSICLSFPPIHTTTQSNFIVNSSIHTSIYLSIEYVFIFLCQKGCGNSSSILWCRTSSCDVSTNLFGWAFLPSFLPAFRLCSYPCLRFYSWWHVITVCPVLCLLLRLLQLHLYLPMKSSWESGECQPASQTTLSLSSLSVWLVILGLLRMFAVTKGLSYLVLEHHRGLPKQFCNFLEVIC